MSTTLNAIVLPDDVIWEDEFQHTAVKQNISVTLGGKQIVEEGVKIKSRPISIMAQWLDKLVVDALIVERDTPNNTMLLTLDDGRFFNVRFKHDSIPLAVEPIVERPSYLTGDYFDVKIKLFEV